jgi:hypothetical protein
LREVAARVLREVPGATLARDGAGRVTDIAIDHAESVRLDVGDSTNDQAMFVRALSALDRGRQFARLRRPRRSTPLRCAPATRCNSRQP